MCPLEAVKHSNNDISIIDLDQDLDISQLKWNFVFDPVLEKSQSVYFWGNRHWPLDDQFNQLVEDISEKILVDLGSNHFRLLFRLKEIAMTFNRRKISNLWQYYEFPALLFLKKQAQEPELVKLYLEAENYGHVVKGLSEAVVVFRNFQQNVLWIKSDENLDSIFNSSGIKTNWL